MKSWGQRAVTNRIKNECDRYVQKNMEDIRYALYKDIVQDDFRQAEAVLLYCLSLHGFGTKRLQRIHSWIIAILNTPEIFGKKVTVADAMTFLREKHGIDFSQIVVNYEKQEERK